MKVQRLRFRFRITGDAATLTHRDLVSALEESAKASAIPLAYSEGKRPAPQISIAAPLPQGVTSDCELVDIFLSEYVEPAQAVERISPHLPDGLQPISASDAGVSSPSLQSQLRWAEYEVAVPESGLETSDLRHAIDRILEADTLPSEYRRENKVRAYDLRPLILDIRLDGQRDGCFVLCMRLRAEPDKTGRADQVVNALGLPPPLNIRRRSLYLEEISPATLSYRAAGERED